MDSGKSDIPVGDATFTRNDSVNESDTVPRQVLWQREHRTCTDKFWGVLFLLSYIAFIGCGIAITSYSNDRYDVVIEANETTRYYVSSYFRDEVKQCCKNIDEKSEDGDDYIVLNNWTYNLCDQLRPDENDVRQLRYLEETEGSSFRGDEGIFDAFLDAPEIVVGITALIIAVGLGWVILLRFFSKPVVIFTELAKIAIFIYLGIKSGWIIFYFIAAANVAYDIWAREQIIFAAEIISYSVVSFRENPMMFLATIVLQLLFAGNAFLFVLFFSKSFNIAEVSDDCYYEYPGFIDDVVIYMSVAYLWSIFLFHRMRLSVIATIIGSWHFHPGDKPGIMTALLNTTISFGTLSVSSLISTVAERICRIAQEPCYKSWFGCAFFVTAPLHILLCIFGTCIGEIIKMLTKYAVILHVWTGLPFLGSAKKAGKILSRHFKGGYVTEVTSQSVLKLASYAFSIGIGIVAWLWFDDKFNTETLSREGYELFWFAISGLFLLWFPVLGLYIIILIDKSLRTEMNSNQDLWVAPLAGIFIGCISMMFFIFLSEIFLDTIDTLFLGFAVDKDNDDISNLELAKLVEKLPMYIREVLDHQDEEVTPVAPMAVAAIIPETPQMANVVSTKVSYDEEKSA